MTRILQYNFMIHMMLRYAKDTPDLRKYVCDQIYRESILSETGPRDRFMDIKKFNVPSSMPSSTDIDAFTMLDGFQWIDVQSREAGMYVGVNRRHWLTVLEIMFSQSDAHFHDARELKLLLH